MKNIHTKQLQECLEDLEDARPYKLCLVCSRLPVSRKNLPFGYFQEVRDATPTQGRFCQCKTCGQPFLHYEDELNLWGKGEDITLYNDYWAPLAYDEVAAIVAGTTKLRELVFSREHLHCWQDSIFTWEQPEKKHERASR